jgi:benzoyl-CoA reductase/2-hydroxyglutaryl-CoA dehydratase subunit BcrC/BadD/HgdB
MRRVGITSTVPVEVILAAGAAPVDLNNLFITHPRREEFIARAEQDGFPANLCAWIKGIYGAVLSQAIPEVIGVTRGDCSSTEKLLEVLRLRGVATIPFAYPADRSREALVAEIETLARHFGARPETIAEVRSRLSRIRRKLARLDELTWQEGKVTGRENHLWLVSASDFFGDPDRYEQELDQFLAQAERRPARPAMLRLGYVGVPPILDDLYQALEREGAAVVFNETQRQFAMLDDSGALADQYRRYTYPYDIQARVRDIRTEARRRRLQGIVHYAQTFCHRQIEAIVFRETLPLPVLSIEADRPGPVDGRTLTRLQAFLETLSV